LPYRETRHNPNPPERTVMLKSLGLFLLLFSLKASGQYSLAIINDPAGFINVQRDKNPKSQVVGRLFDDDVFNFDVQDQNDEWVEIYFSTPFNKLKPEQRDYYTKELHYKRSEVALAGYVLRNRITPLENLKKISDQKLIPTHNDLKFQNDSVSFEIELNAFAAVDHDIDEGGNNIDGTYAFGVFGNVPKTEIKKIALKINTTTVSIPKRDYKDLFEANLELINLYVDKRNVIYIYMPWNSDGAGAYDAVWIIKNKKYLKRYVDNSND
jgi:hypothetical protein